MKARSCFAAFMLLFLFSCNLTDKNRIAISATNFKDEIPATQNLQFTFNRNVVADSLLNIWLSGDIISFDPPMEGNFRFIANDKVEFSPKHAFRESENYSVRISKGIFDYSDLQLQLSNKELTFHTPYVDLVRTDMYWSKDEAGGEIILNADLHFSATVNTEEIAKAISIRFEKQNIPFAVVSKGNSSKVSMVLRNISPHQTEEQVNISIAPGLSSPGSNYKTQEQIVQAETIPFIEYVEIRDVTSQHNGFEGEISFVTNQQIANTNLHDAITIKPEVTFTTEKLSNGFKVVSSDFDPTQKYTVTVSETLLGVAGGKMPDVFEDEVQFGSLRPLLQFANSKGKYLGSRGNRNLAIQIVNVPKIKVEISKIYENNILAFLRYENSDGWNSDYSDDYYYDDYDYYGGRMQTDLYGNVIFEKEYDTKSLEKAGYARVLHIDRLHTLEKFDGFYVVTVSSPDDRWMTESKIVSVSDIGLITKASDEEIMVFANSLLTADAAAGIKINFISSNNQKLYSAVTDANGVAKFSNVQKNYGAFKVDLITAESGNDFNFLPLRQTEVSTSRFDVGGKRPNDADLDAFLYAERDLYRPGETMHLSAIIRDYAWRSAADIPVKLTLLSPAGKEFKTLKKTTNNNGAFETAIDMPLNAVTGNYTAQLLTANDILIASKIISVEEFMPDRIKVNASLQKSEYRPGEKITVAIQADNLFGTPAADRNWEAEMNLQRRYFHSQQYPGYDFYFKTNNHFNTDNTEGTTNAQGIASASFDLSSAYTDMGILDGSVLTTVFDESGRPVYDMQHFSVVTQDVFFGIGNFDNYVNTRESVKIPIIAVDKNGELVNDIKVKIDIIKHDYETVVERDGDYFRYRSNNYEKMLVSETRTLNGRSSVNFIPELSGTYEVRIYRPDARVYVSRTFNAFGWRDTQSNSFEVNTEGNISIVSDKENYKTGETAKLLFTAPFNGKMLVTVERNKVLEYFYLTTDKKTATLKLPVTDKHVPNMYVTATLFRPSDNSAMPLTVAHGILDLKVDNASKKLAVKITSAKNSRANKKQTVQIKTAPYAELTVAVVDEGILQIKNYKTPDPYNWFYSERALDIASYDMYAYLYPELNLKNLLSGGDAASGRINPILAKRIKLVSFWSGIIKADANGNAKFSFDIPQFSGDLRVMAVAYKNDQFASSEEHMKVAEPIVVTTSLPRFLSPGDTIIAAVTLANTTQKSTEGTVSLIPEGPLKVIGMNAHTFSADANKEARIEFSLCATNAIGTAILKTSVQGLNETFTDKTELAVRPAVSLQKRSGFGELKGGGNAVISMANNFLSENSDAKLIVSRSPLIQFTKNLDYLIEYPHGCVEQITSGVFPQIYFSELVKAIYGTENKNMNPSLNVQQGINMLQSMQLHNGALSYWPGRDEESWWGSVYACNFLVEAKKAGYDVDEKVLHELFGYMQAMLKQKKFITYQYNGQNQKEIAPKEVFYSLYVLALAGKPELSTMNYYKANPSFIPLDGKYLLAASYALTGDKKTFQKILPAVYAGEVSVQVLGGSFYSPLRDMAISLNCLLETDPENIQVSSMTKQVADMMKNKEYLNTQENAFGFLALGKIAKRTAASKVTGVVKADGQKVADFKGDVLVLQSKDLLNKKVSMEAYGDGMLYYFWMIKGITRDGSFKQEDNYMQVRKTFYDRYGHEIKDLRSLKQNDLVVVKITATANAVLENVVITDMIPAGFEIENDRLRETAALKWINDQSKNAYEDIRDDRINLYCTLDGRPVHFYYTARAVSPGTYRMGPVMGDAMYNEEYHSYNGAGWIKISR